MNCPAATMVVGMLASMSVAGAVQAQSTPNDPLGINVTDDTSITRQRGALHGGTNSSINALPNPYRSGDTVDDWSFENGKFNLQKSYRHW